jgi:hypothetical protein
MDLPDLPAELLPDPDQTEAQFFLDLLDPNVDRWTFQTFDDSPAKHPHLARVLHGSLDQHWGELAALNQQGAGVFVTVNETDLKGRAAVNVVRVRALFADLDGQPLGAALDALQDAGMVPHMIVSTSPGRWHLYMLVDRFPLALFKPGQKRLIKLLGSDPSVHDLPRVMRLPGFWHRKREPYFVGVM